MRPTRVAFAAVALLAFLESVAVEAHPASGREAEPIGAYSVGTRTVPANDITNTTGRTIQVFYPSPKVPCAGTTWYTVTTPGVGTFRLSSPLCAVEDATVAEGGPFPLFVWAHGGSPAGPDYQRLMQLPELETLASHGFVVAVALHVADPVQKVRDLKETINFLRYGSWLAERIDEDRVGVGGLSAGGGTALGLVGGVATAGIPPNELGVKAMVVYEPDLGVTGSAGVAQIAIPYLLVNGSQLVTPGAAAYAAMFANTTLAVPRYHVFTDRAVHISHQSNTCRSIVDARNQALAVLPPNAEPLTQLFAGNAAAAFAFARWNGGAGAATVGFGAGHNICSELSFVSNFCAGGPSCVGNPVPQPAIPAEEMVPLVVHYTVAFLRIYLGGENDQHGAMAPGQAAHVGPAKVTIIDE